MWAHTYSGKLTNPSQIFLPVYYEYSSNNRISLQGLKRTSVPVGFD